MDATDKTSKQYDYVICGAGTAGCVIARRLAEDADTTVLLLEAGKPKDAVPASSIPAGVGQVVGTDADWNIKSEPCPELNNRQLDLSRGKFVSGSSGCNGTLCIRGVPQDYDDWGVEGWSGADMFAYMNKAEKFQTKDWFDAAENEHGKDGPLVTSPHDPAPISNCILESYQSKGLPLKPDMFTVGDTAHGCGHAVRTAYNGIRTTSYDYIGGNNHYPNLDVVTGNYVDKIVLEQRGDDLIATGVQAQDDKGQQITFKAQKEVIVSSGAYGSPTVLLRSGIGPKSELEDFGIPVKVNLPGVGKNLMDHPIVMNFYEVSKPNLTNDHLIWHTGGKEKTTEEYGSTKTGFLSQIPFGTFAYARLDERLKDDKIWQEACARQPKDSGRDGMGTLPNQPHVEFWNTESYFPKPMFADFPPDGKYAFAMAIIIFFAQSRGNVTLRSLDLAANPKVQHNYLSDPLDMLVFSEACRLSNEIAIDGAGTKDVVIGSWPVASGHNNYTTREQWEEMIRARADTCYHPSGTCKMSSNANDEMAVLDAELRVRGVKNLRVVDASIMPSLPSGHPQMPVYGIAEKAADLIKGVGREPKGSA